MRRSLSETTFVCTPTDQRADYRLRIFTPRADLPKAEADALIRAMAPGEANAFEYDWRYRARPEQPPPAGSWRIWLLMAGRGFGKTRCGAEWVRARSRRGVVGSP